MLSETFKNLRQRQQWPDLAALGGFAEHHGTQIPANPPFNHLVVQCSTAGVIRQYDIAWHRLYYF